MTGEGGDGRGKREEGREEGGMKVLMLFHRPTKSSWHSSNCISFSRTL